MRVQEDTSRMRDANVRLNGRILYLTEDPAFVRTQLAGNDPLWTPEVKLRDDISTDEITPSQRSEEHTSELQSRGHLVCRLLLEKKKYNECQARQCYLSNDVGHYS